MIKRALGLVGAVLLVGVGAANAACPTKIGLILPMTGPIAPVAQGMLKAAELAAEQVNAAGGSNGCPVKLIVRDTQGQPSLAVDAARQIVDLEGARVVIGEALSGTTLAVLNSVTVPAGIPLISPTASAPTFSEIGAKTGLFYRANISDALQGIAAAHYAQREKSGAVSIFAINNDWGQNLSRVFKAAYEKLGGSVKKIVFYNPDQPSYRAEVTSVIESQPDTLYFIGYVTEAARIVRDWISQGGTQRLLFPHNLNDANFVSAVGPKFLTQAIWLTPGESATPSLDNFRNAYQARYNEFPNGPGRTSTYDVVVLTALAIAAAKTDFDGKAIAAAFRKVTDPAAPAVYAGEAGIKAALAAIADGKPVNYVGAVGPLQFDASGDIAGAFVTWKLDDAGALKVTDRMSADEVQALRKTLMP